MLTANSEGLEVGTKTEEAAQFIPTIDPISSDLETTQETTRYTLLQSGIPGGEQLVCFEKSHIRLQQMTFRGRLLKSVIKLNPEGSCRS